jgi:hypothetical protein
MNIGRDNGCGRPDILFGADSVATTKFVGCSHRKRSRYAPVLAGRYLRWASEFTPECGISTAPISSSTTHTNFVARHEVRFRPHRFSWQSATKFRARGLMRPRRCHRIYARIRWSSRYYARNRASDCARTAGSLVPTITIRLSAQGRTICKQSRSHAYPAGKTDFRSGDICSLSRAMQIRRTGACIR